jgi:hypothetical protein
VWVLGHRDGSRLCDAGIVPIMLVHDGILFDEEDPRKIEEAREIMRAVGREVCDGIDVGVDLDWSTMQTGRRYRDKRPLAMKMGGHQSTSCNQSGWT